MGPQNPTQFRTSCKMMRGKAVSNPLRQSSKLPARAARLSSLRLPILEVSASGPMVISGRTNDEPCHPV